MSTPNPFSLSIRRARPTARRPIWLPLRPPPTTMCSVVFHSSSWRNRAVTVASSPANSSMADEPRGQRVVAFKILVQLRFRQLPGRRVTERVRAVLADVLAPLVEDAPEGALVRAVAEEPSLVLEL